MKAIWNNTIVAESDQTKVVEGNHYFPRESLHKEYFKSSKTTSTCHWKGIAAYYNLEVDGDINKDAAWYHPEPSELASAIKGHVAFWRGVQIVD